MYRIQHLSNQRDFLAQINFESFRKIVGYETVEAVIEACGVKEKRERKLPACLTIWLCILMNMMSELALDSVLGRMVKGSRLRCGVGVATLANKSSISKARYRLGERPLAMLFERVCQPLAQPETQGAFAYGLRLVAIDSTVETTADTAANEQAFGRQPANRKFAGSAFPQVRCVYACECGTHAMFDAIFLAYRDSDVFGAKQLLRSVTADMLVMVDCGLYGFELVAGVVERQSHVLCRVRSSIRPPCQKRLVDGSYLATIMPSDYHLRKAGHALTVRVIEYTFDDPHRPGYRQRHRLITTLLDPLLYPADELICLYHERWEIELTIDEIDTHQRLLTTPLRSLKPEGVRQELYGLLLAHYLIRAFMHQAALDHHLDPDRLSFAHALPLVLDTVAAFQLIASADHPFLWWLLLEDITHFLLPPRDNRIHPRVVKRKRSKFRTKRPLHAHPPQPLKRFADGIVILHDPLCA